MTDNEHILQVSSEAEPKSRERGIREFKLRLNFVDSMSLVPSTINEISKAPHYSITDRITQVRVIFEI